MFDNLVIEQVTPIVQEGTALNKVLFDSINNDILDRLLISNKATVEEARGGIDDEKYMTALKVLELINVKALPSKQLSIKTGTISSGSTIPKTSGYSNYMYFVSHYSASESHEVADNDTKHGVRINCSVDQSTRKVTCTMGYYRSYSISASIDFTWHDLSGTANYIEFAWN